MQFFTNLSCIFFSTVGKELHDLENAQVKALSSFI